MLSVFKIRVVVRCCQIQIVGYNTELYGNLSQAIYASNGLAGVSLLAQVRTFDIFYFSMMLTISYVINTNCR